jgi:hypothetical protein
VFVVLGVGGIFDCIALFNWLATDEIRVRYGSLTVEHRAPFLLRQRTFKTADVADIFPKMDGDSPAASGGGKKRIFHSLMLKTPDGDLVRLANDIIQKDYAAWLADEIKGAFGVAARK